jgi:hypothetical protein
MAHGIIIETYAECLLQKSPQSHKASASRLSHNKTDFIIAAFEALA